VDGPTLRRRSECRAERQAGAETRLGLVAKDVVTEVLNLSAFGQGQRVLGVYAQVAHRAFKLGVAQQDLHRP